MLSGLRHALRPDRRGGGLPRVHLALVLAFLVVAVIDLTRTVVSALDIADTAAAIDSGLQPVERNTEQIRLLDGISGITGEIMQETAPVPAQAAEVDRAVGGIRAGVGSIEQTSVAIQDQVRGIAAHTGDINTTAEELGGTVSSIERTAASIRSSAVGINERFAALLPVTRTIARGLEPFGVNNINKNTDAVIDLLNELEPDLDNVLVSVDEIDGHAVSICRSTVVMGRDCR